MAHLPFIDTISSFIDCIEIHLSPISQNIQPPSLTSFNYKYNYISIIIQKFNINGRLLKFLQNYLTHRKQKVILDNISSNILDVKSGVPQGSILGPLLFIMLINDIYDCIDPNTKISQYADVTKIWRQIQSEHDCEILQTDVNKLQVWCANKKMNYNTQKCHALAVKATEYLLTDELPFSSFFYSLDDRIIDYSYQERDLGVLINSKFNFADHHQAFITKAYQFLGLTKRSCHFVTDKQRRRNLYLAMVRSQFEQCSIVWAPKLQSEIDKFEKVQKRALKWILRLIFQHSNVLQQM